MAQSLDALRASLSTEERAEVEAEKARMRAEIHALRRLRMARDMTQTQLAEVLGMTQGELSRLEARSDIMLSTLRRVIQGMGGKMEIHVLFDGDDNELVLTSLEAESEENLGSLRKRVRHKQSSTAA
jgi:transcriptional regulator with XRE-family HTH domain